jgi:hypothetical protein
MTAYKVILCLLFLSACNPKPFVIRPISDHGARQIIATETAAEPVYDNANLEKLRASYRRAHSPSFGIIDGFYQLPKARPYGSATMVREYSYYSNLEAIKLEPRQHEEFVIQPLNGDEALALNKALNALLDIGVRFHEISMKDALSIAHAEKAAMKDKKNFLWSEQLGPSVDYLMSIDKAHSAQGPVLVGRVLSKDGRLLAFRVLSQGSSSKMLSAMIMSLFEDTVTRL